MKTRGNNPKRRIVPTGYFSQAELAGFAVRARYEGSALHKLKPADYGFHPPANPRASKSACDDIRIIKRREASDLLKAAFARGMVSACEPQALPKYAWAVDADREAYEAKLGREGYHGYRLGEDDREMRAPHSRSGASLPLGTGVASGPATPTLHSANGAGRYAPDAVG